MRICIICIYTHTYILNFINELANLPDSSKLMLCTCSNQTLENSYDVLALFFSQGL